MSAEPHEPVTATAFLERQGVRARRVEFLGVPLDPLGMEETVALIDRAIARRVCLKHVVVNVAKLVAMRRDPALHRDVVESDLINVDGMGVVWGARLCGVRTGRRVAGIDLMERLLDLCERRGYRPFILGAKPEVLERAVARLRTRHPDLRLAGWQHGYFTPEEEPLVVEAIRRSGADCLFVAMSSPVKERFTQQYREALGVPFLMGVGGSVDVLAGLTRRAPVWVQRCGLEWAFRVAQEPRRLWRRYWRTNTAFAGLLLAELAGRRSRRPPLARS